MLNKCYCCPSWFLLINRGFQFHSEFRQHELKQRQVKMNFSCLESENNMFSLLFRLVSENGYVG